MRLLVILIAAIAFIVGCRMILVAGRTAFSGKMLVRQGIRSRWQPAASINDAWKVAIRDALMGLLLIVLSVSMLA
jgi:hypothetical protein